ncbi:MAG: CDP-alcohol phosphatidyltransferase family protein, partial [Oscillospiraceae bacterium]|nr:CDP-alcohol phosphatidyltransferase family protein [Oscillospiraceae bacterium]
MNLPNKLTVLRMVLVPVFIFFLLTDIVPASKLIALAVFALASVTDALDGHIARSRGLVTTFGKFLDPLAD